MFPVAQTIAQVILDALTVWAFVIAALVILLVFVYSWRLALDWQRDRKPSAQEEIDQLEDCWNGFIDAKRHHPPLSEMEVR